MKRKLLIALAACALTISGCAGVASALKPMSPKKVANGDTGSFAANISAKNTISCSTAPTGTTFSLTETYSTSQQMTSGNSQTLVVNMPDHYYLTGLTLSMKSNSKGGAGNLKVNGTTVISTASFNTESWYGAWSTSFVDIVVNTTAFNDLIANNDVNDFTIILAATANSLYCRSYTMSWGYYEDPNVYHSVTYHSLGGGDFDDSVVIEGQAVGSLPTPSKPKDEENQKRYVFDGWYILSNSDNPANPTFEDATAFTASSPVNADLNVYAKYTEIQYYKVTFNSMGGSDIALQEVDSGQKATLPDPAPTKQNNKNYSYAFAAWCSDSSCNVEYDFDASVSNNITLYAKWNRSLRPAVDGVAECETISSLSYSNYHAQDNSITDTINRAFTGVDDGASSYSNWSGKTGTSGVVYAGNSAGTYNSVQLRAKDNAGIITTANAAEKEAKKVTVRWNDGTASGRIIQVFGKNQAYSATSDLYAAATKGTLLAELNIDDSTDNVLSANITGSYKFIALRSKESAQYIDSFEVQWGVISFTYDDLAIRFSGSVEQELFERLDTESDIQGYGMLLAEYDTIKDNDPELKNWLEYADLYDNDDLKNFTNANTVHDPAEKVTPTLKDGNYVWNLFKRVSLAKATTEYVAVAYIKLANDEFVFLQQERITVKKLAQDLIAGPDRDESSLGGSLNYLANL